MHRNEFLRRKKKRIIGTSLLRSSLPSNLFEDMSRGKLLWTQATRVAAAARPQRRDSSTIHHDLHGFRTRVCHRPRDGRRVAPARAGGYGAKGDSPISFFLRQNAFEPEKSSIYRPKDRARKQWEAGRRVLTIHARTRSRARQSPGASRCPTPRESTPPSACSTHSP